MFCTFCGKNVDDDSVFCVYCGKKFDEVIVLKGPDSNAAAGQSASQPGMQQTSRNASLHAEESDKGGSQFQAAVCPCCTAPLRLDMDKCEYCGTTYIRNIPQQPATVPTVQVVAQPIQIVAQPPAPYAGGNGQMNYDDGYSQMNYNAQMNYNNQLLMAQNFKAQKDAEAKIAAAAIRGGAEITSAAIRGGARLASSLLFHRFF